MATASEGIFLPSERSFARPAGVDAMAMNRCWAPLTEGMITPSPDQLPSLGVLIFVFLNAVGTLFQRLVDRGIKHLVDHRRALLVFVIQGAH